MELDERKVKILKAIISNYLETGEPVGSTLFSRIHRQDGFRQMPDTGSMSIS